MAVLEPLFPQAVDGFVVDSTLQLRAGGVSDFMLELEPRDLVEFDSHHQPRGRDLEGVGGYPVGADLTYLFTEHIGVGGLVRPVSTERPESRYDPSNLFRISQNIVPEAPRP